MKKLIKIKSWFLALTVVLAVFVGTGCDVDNNHLTLREFTDHLSKSGVKVEQVQPIEADVIKAQKAVAVKIAGSEIGVYKFNIDFKNQAKRLKRIHKNGYVYMLGLKFPVVVKGTFVLVNVHKNPEKHKILKALETFK
ncbi:hypothetical protein P0136_03225 [Lentisphaerota bacterium ZTH]|nr:hypothetical protein JYG24_05640 [Lentisphaerota bacterium]WET07014.1 hypothetical protein P0136_03225 [Lentisphaerota bacterium ZTH]